MNLAKGSILLFSVISFLVLTSCGYSNAGNNKPNNTSKVYQGVTSGSSKNLSAGPSKIQLELDKAKSEGKAVFLIVTGTGTIDTDQASTKAKEAIAIFKNATIIQMDRDDASNAQLVSEWRLAGAPLPLILVISPKGLVTVGLIASQATAENLAALIPSPKMEELIAVLNAKKPAFVVFTKKSNPDRKEVLHECTAAVTILKNNATIIEVDLDDYKEANFINRLGVDKSSKESTTQVVNTQGQVVGTSSGTPDAAKLAAAAIAPPKSGCCPGGAGSAGCAK